jgi:anaerobic selenocysteine-containing dehydrogenase/Fe-S-cluster-containing dehydrogenase component
VTLNRREFLGVIGASGAAAAAAGCGRATEQILPYVVPPENLVPGVAAWFSTVCRECPAGCGVIARNRDGRVVKLEGNPDHPVNAGALCLRGQAGLQGLYNPDRLRGPLRGDGAGGFQPVAWEDAEKTLADRVAALVKERRGSRIAVVSELQSGSLGQLMDAWARAVGARPRVAFEPLAHEAIRAASRAVFGRDAIPHYALEEAHLLLSFGADFLETWLSPVGHAAAFARMHAFRHGRVGTFVHVEPRLSLTAANADEWVRCAPGTEAPLAWAVLRTVVDAGLLAPGADARMLRAAVRDVDVEGAARESGVGVETIRRLGQAFARARPGLAIGGGAATGGPHAVALETAVHLLNEAAGNVGRTVRFGPDAAFGKASPYAEVLALVEAMARGEVDVLLLVHANPLFALPARTGIAEALGKVPLVVSFSNQPDETTQRAHLVLPDRHPLEAWGDWSPREGVVGLLQPVMAPVFDSRPAGDVLLVVARQALGIPEGRGPLGAPSFEAYLRERWREIARAVAPGIAFERFWEAALRRGGVWREVPPSPVRARRPEAPAPRPLEGDPGGAALIVFPSNRFYDGRGANKPWLQETPDTMTQVVWDAWVEVPAETARRLALRDGDLVKVTSPHGALELPAVVSASLHPGAVAIPLGQGHTAYGRYAKDRGASPLALLPGGASPGGLPFLSVRVTLEKTGRRRPLARVQTTADQDHREIAQAVGLPAARELELRGAVPPKANLPSMYPTVKYPEHRWGMVVDADACTGCGACVVACQAENNVAVVGKERIAYGRGMQWLRVERWWEGAPARPETLFLPMFCQHCEVAPCEPVCPVFAAYHTDEGLNAQVYNRCVGTRYCGNNCPYHVRRFNFFDYASPRSRDYAFPEPLPLQLNPDVTVRQLGIMEKCTMCVQRIIAGKDRARDEGRKARDGDILTACQQTCPTGAIVFGDLKDPESRVSRLSRSPRGYHVLEEIGTRPAVTYLKKVTRGAGPPPGKAHG